MTDSRLLTAEQVQELMHLHGLCDSETHQDRKPHCRYCGGQDWPCETQQLADHIAAQAEQLDRQAVLMAWLHSLGGRGYSDEACEELDGYLGVSWRRRDDPNRERVLDEIEAIRRHGVEVAKGRQA